MIERTTLDRTSTDRTPRAQLILENGERFTGKAFGHLKESVGEVIFSTRMTGYQELITDPSSSGKLLVMTYPLIGNYGINLEDMESSRVMCKGLVVREYCDYPSNWRCELEISGFLKQNKTIGLTGIDTRALTKTLRSNGIMKGIITPRYEELSAAQIEQKFLSYHTNKMVEDISTKEAYELGTENSVKIAVLDLGVKRSLLDILVANGARVKVYPVKTSAEDILKDNPDGILFSNGPGNPENLSYIKPDIIKLAKAKPTLGVCLGFVMLVSALGAGVEKMKFGHHGVNHPVRDLAGQKIYTTAQNHEYTLTDLESAPDIVVTHVNVNDGTVEGIEHKCLPAAGYQFLQDTVMVCKSFEYISKFIKLAERRVSNA